MVEVPVKSHTNQLPSFRLDGRIAVVTGASLGIGQAIAVAFATAGAQLALVSRQIPHLAETVAGIEAVCGQASCFQADLRSVPQIQRLVQEVLAEHGQVDILVNAAGLPQTRRASDVTEKDWDAVIDTSLKGVYFSCLYFAGPMTKRGYGKIINLSSTYSESVATGKSVYATAKAGVSQLTRALALEWAPFGVRVNALAPTVTVTPTRRGVLADKERLDWLLSRIPLGRCAQPEDLVGAALFLASEASDFVTGHTLFVDGGWHAAR